MSDPGPLRWHLGHGLRACRLAAGRSREQVAMGVYGAAELAELVADLEGGRIDEVSLDLLLRLTDVLGISPGELSARAWVES